MRAALTLEPNRLSVVSVPDPEEPGPGTVLLRPELVGICGSDLHFYTGHLNIPTPNGSLYPKIQGHELCGRVEAVGEGVDHALLGQRVALWPLRSCGTCYPCRVGRPSVCDNFELIGIHLDGGLAELVVAQADQIFPIADLAAPLGSFVEPVAVAVHALERGGLAAGETLVVLGGGPIGQALALAGEARGARVILSEPVAERRAIASSLGVEVVVDPRSADLVAMVRELSDGEGAPLVVDSTGSPAAIRDGVEMVASAGRLVIVSIADRDVALPIGAFTSKEIDLLGSSCHDPEDFVDAVVIVRDAAELLAPHLVTEYPLEEAPAAFAYSAAHPDGAMKVMIRVP